MTHKTKARWLSLLMAMVMCGSVGLAACNPTSTSTSSGSESSDTGSTSTSTDDASNVEDIAESTVSATGTTSGDLDANGKFYTNYSTVEEAREAAQDLNIQMAQEGQVLLKNENNALPLGSNENYVTLLGIGSYDMLVSGGGSGSASQTSYTTSYNWKTGLEAAGFHVNPKTWSLYENYYSVNKPIYTGSSLEIDMSYYTNSIVSTYKGYNDAAIVVLHRFGTENQDLATNNADGHSDENDTELDLQDNEIALIKHAKANFDKVIVILNTSNTMSLGDLAEEKTDDNLGVDAILWVGGVGQVGTYAAGTILNGEVNPSGHTVDTWWSDVKKDPSFTNFSDMTQNIGSDGNRMSAFFRDSSTQEETIYATVEYREDIYMGYRYTETGYVDMEAAKEGSGEEWYSDLVAYPFGYGLSYTTFDWELAGRSASLAIEDAAQTITIKVKVTNTGSVAGKEVVQLYYSAPYTSGGIEKAAVNLVGFAKTDMLDPGESETVTVQFVAQDMASFDWNDANGNGYCGYELEAGTYTISARNSAHEELLSVDYTIASDIRCTTDYTSGSEIKPVFVDDYTTMRDSLENNLLSRADGMSQPAAETNEERVLESWEQSTLESQEFYRPFNDEEGQDWYTSSVPSTWTQGASTSVTLADLSGTEYIENKIVNGKVEETADDADTKMWEEYMNSLSYDELLEMVADNSDIVNTGVDGPVQFGSGTCWSTSPISAATWNEELLEEQGEMYGTEAIFNGNIGWRGGGLDTHRSPFNGRCFEYYSEDGVLSGILGAAVTRGVTSKGVITYYKHFFANDQEYKRADYGGVAEFFTEQAAREIYLKPFEYVVKAGALGLMTSFNRVGYVVNSDNWAVHETLLRDEWGFKGATVTDAWAKSHVSLDLMLRAGDDMVLGGSSSFTDTYFSASRWNEEANCAEVIAERESSSNNNYTASGIQDSDTWVVSPTQYYAVRKSAQRALYAFVNSNGMKNNSSNLVITANVYYGVSNTAMALSADSSDLTITLPDGVELASGLSISGNVVSYAAVNGEYLAEGTYTYTVDVAMDSWIETEATLIINVVSPISLDGVDILGGSTADDPLLTLQTGESYEYTFSSNYYTPHTWIGSWQYVNWYYNDTYGYYNRDEDKTAADIITHSAAEADLSKSCEFNFTYTGDLPEGMTFELVYSTVTGMGGSYECVTGYKLSGTPTQAGTYEVTIVYTVPQVMCFGSGWLFVSFGHSYLTVTKTITIVVE